MEVGLAQSQLMALNGNKTSKEGNGEKQRMKSIESQIMKK